MLQSLAETKYPTLFIDCELLDLEKELCFAYMKINYK